MIRIRSRSLNPQEVLEFNTAIEGENKINNKKVYAALLLVYYYSSAMSYRLSLQGDLSDNNEVFDESLKPGLEAEESNKQEQSIEDNKTVLNELNDLE